MKHFDLNAAILFGAATLQGILLAIHFLFNQKGSRKANFLIMAMIVSITLIIFQNFIIFNGSYTDYPHLIFLFYPLNGLIGPLFLMYVLFLLHPERKFKAYDLLHLGIFAWTLFEHWGFLSRPVESKISVVEYLYYGDAQFKLSSVLRMIFFRTVVLAYGLASLYLIKTKINELKLLTSNTNLQYLNQFRWVVYLFIAYAFSSIAGHVYSLVFEVTIGRYEIYHHIANSVIVVTLAVIAMRQPERLAFVLQPKPAVVKPRSSPRLSLDGLAQLMEDHKPYLNPDLKLHDLAKLSDMPPHILSDQINQTLKMNFYEFVNQYRVAEFKRRVESDEYTKYTLLAIAFDVGFNSKASFNRIFKQQTQMTPSAYARQKRVSTSQVETIYT